MVLPSWLDSTTFRRLYLLKEASENSSDLFRPSGKKDRNVHNCIILEFVPTNTTQSNQVPKLFRQQDGPFPLLLCRAQADSPALQA